MTEYKTLVADPPWPSQDPGRMGSAAKHYDLMTTEEICGYLTNIGVTLAPKARLFLWRLASFPQEALTVCKAWGFIPKTELIWLKQTKNGNRWFGMGHTLRGEHETCIVAVRKRGGPPILNHSTRSTFSAPITEHSRKPDAFYALVESLSPGPYLDLFARVRRPGWDSLGDLDGEDDQILDNVQPSCSNCFRIQENTKDKVMTANTDSTLKTLAVDDKAILFMEANSKSYVVEVTAVNKRQVTVRKEAGGFTIHNINNGEVWGKPGVAHIRHLTPAEREQINLTTKDTSATLQQYCIVSLMNTHHVGADWVLHTADCADVAKLTKTGGEILTTGDFVQVQEWFDKAFGEDSDFSDDPWLFNRDIDFAPCANKTFKPSKTPKTTKAPTTSYADGPACYCGCGNARTSKSFFLMGHDMKLCGKLGRGQVEGVPAVALTVSFLVGFHNGKYAHMANK